VRIFCDDLPVLNLLASGVEESIKSKIDLQPWEASFSNARHPVDIPDVVIEAFGCKLPERYLGALLACAKQPIIINLEYLSAEPWIVDFHTKASPQAHGLPKYFFFPGFQENVGGILVDPVPPQLPSTPESLKVTWVKLRPHTKRISVFCYPGAPLRKWLEDLSSSDEDFDILLTHGHAELLGLHTGQQIDLPPSSNLHSIPFVSQDEYDWLLSQCDFNIVRGEDSFVRAQLAGKPFLWHIYPQEDRAHEVKLAAFLDLYLETADQDLKNACIRAMNWEMPSQWMDHLDAWEKHSQAWKLDLLKKQADGGLAARLLHFVA